MTAEYLVLGIILVLMGGLQTWLRHSGTPPNAAGRGLRSGKVWNKWTAVQGPVAVVLGVVLVVLGVLGR